MLEQGESAREHVVKVAVQLAVGDVIMDVGAEVIVTVVVAAGEGTESFKLKC